MYRILFWVATVMAFSTIIFFALIITNGIVHLLLKMRIFKVDPTPIFIIIFVIYSTVIITESILIISIGARLLYVIRKRSQNVSNVKANPSTHEAPSQKPYIKIVGLVIGMVLSAFIQILSAVVSIFTSLYFGYLHIIDYFLQCFGVLVFAIFVLLLFNPLIQQTEEKGEKQMEIPQEKKEKEFHQVVEQIKV